MSNTSSHLVRVIGRNWKASPTEPTTTCGSISAGESKGDLSKITLKEEAEDYHKGPLSFFDEQNKERYIPYVIEPSAGVDRSTLAFLVDAYDEEEVKNDTRSVLRFHPHLAPIKAAIFPLVKKG
jgi:glycyl-tRNA synthetase